jgi:hypothetical protein
MEFLATAKPARADFLAVPGAGEGPPEMGDATWKGGTNDAILQ